MSSPPDAPTPADRPTVPSDGSPPKRPTLTPLSRWVLTVGIPVMLIVAGTAVWLLLGLGVDRDQLDAIRTGGTLGAGLGGVVILWLAVRRQRSTELDLLHKYDIAQDARDDAAERRITELYTKAVEQLGSDKAPVRLGGLYALERLAQNNAGQRQTIVNVLCAYLRMPYVPPGGRLADNADADAHANHEQRTQEREVRLTAQRILAAHLRPGTRAEHPRDVYWGGMDLDLTGATLIDLDLHDCHIKVGQFGGATFTGRARFYRTRFTELARFSGAHFTHDVRFEDARFGRTATFYRAKFAGKADFDKAIFASSANFSEVRFGDFVSFYRARFGKDAKFGHSKFAKNGGFTSTEFVGDAWFGDVEFTGEAHFGYVKFSGNAWFDGTTWAGTVGFANARFAREAKFYRAKYAKDVEFNRALFATEARFDEVEFAGHTRFDGVEFAAGLRYADATFACGVPEEFSRPGVSGVRRRRRS